MTTIPKAELCKSDLAVAVTVMMAINVYILRFYLASAENIKNILQFSMPHFHHLQLQMLSISRGRRTGRLGTKICNAFGTPVVLDIINACMSDSGC